MAAPLSDPAADVGLVPPSVAGRVVLVTGGAGGLGTAIADTLGAAGAVLLLLDLDAQKLRHCVASLQQRGIQAFAFSLDVGNAAQCAEVVSDIGQRFGHIDALVNNAAIDVTAPLEELSIEDCSRVLACNLFGPLVLTKLAIPLMRKSGGGHVVNITSTAAKRAWPNASLYHASKWGLLGLSHALHAELRGDGIRVCAVVAGGMKTPFLLDRFPDIDTTRLQAPEHVAEAIHFVLKQPPGTCIPEIMVLPVGESSWP